MSLTCSRIEVSVGVPRDSLAVSASGRDDRFYESAKSALDYSGALILLILAAPIMLIVALMLKVTSRGPVIYCSKRLGRRGRVFDCYKFRTMVVDADRVLEEQPDLREQFTRSYKLKHDPRVTRLGRFLRRTSLDELPQIFNVFRGEISMVGPRPILPSQLERYGDDAHLLLSVKPGLSGFWQVHGRSLLTHEERIRCDLYYIRRRSMLFDLELLLRTPLAVISGRGAY